MATELKTHWSIDDRPKISEWRGTGPSHCSYVIDGSLNILIEQSVKDSLIEQLHRDALITVVLLNNNAMCEKGRLLRGE